LVRERYLLSTMSSPITTSDDFDSPWKEALQAFLPHFLDFFFSDIHADIDWSQGYVALDEEFQQIVQLLPCSATRILTGGRRRSATGDGAAAWS
jgi:hypothetical protein